MEREEGALLKNGYLVMHLHDVGARLRHEHALSISRPRDVAYLTTWVTSCSNMEQIKAERIV